VRPAHDRAYTCYRIGQSISLGSSAAALGCRAAGRAPLKFQRPECDPCCSKAVRCNNSDRETRDEGRVEANMVFTYLDAFDEDHIAVEDLKALYIGSG
jgi:hypothetical protein